MELLFRVVFILNTYVELETLQKLAVSIGKRPHDLKLSPSEVVELQAALNLSTEGLLREVALIGKQWSHPPISKFEGKHFFLHFIFFLILLIRLSPSEQE
jgi:hypothetical protein